MIVEEWGIGHWELDIGHWKPETKEYSPIRSQIVSSITRCSRMSERPRLRAGNVQFPCLVGQAMSKVTARPL